MKLISKIAILSTAAALACSCTNSKHEMGTYGYDLQYLNSKGIDVVELKSEDGMSKLMIVPAWQGRVMTSTTGGDNGASYGWINYRFIDEGVQSSFFNPFGGEERFWIGPEGGPNSWYFKKGDAQIYENWVVPAGIDTEAYAIESQSDKEVVFTHRMDIRNASDYLFNIGVRRAVEMVDRQELKDILGVELPSNLNVLGYRTVNTLINEGEAAWNKVTGMPSVWLLGSFNPTPTTTVFIPYNRDYEGKIVNDEYFGKVPSDRLFAEDGMIYFKIDGEYRSKIGLPKGSATDICGSYDSDKKVLNILKFNIPEGDADYVNGQWGDQEDPFCGDVINSYNDGPTETGYVQGPFYEIETSSPGAALAPGQSLTHTQYTIHIEGDENDLAQIAKAVFGADLNKISKAFK